MKTAIIIPTRLSSNRIPQKSIREINGKPLICHLVDYIKKYVKLDIIIACPESDFETYNNLLGPSGVKFYCGSDKDPLERMAMAADHFNLDIAIRVCHDKFLVDDVSLLSALYVFEQNNHDYVFSSSVIDGGGFEIISADLLKQASSEFENVEFISYAVRLLAKNPFDYEAEAFGKQGRRLLIDFPEDLVLAELLAQRMGNCARLGDIVMYLKANPWALEINKLPKITVYTCAHNAEEFLGRALASVERQTCFDLCEYILVDDHSTDKTPEIMAKFALQHKNVKWIRNQKNLGLASSSNVALKNARGKYIVRLDADDFFVPLTAIQELYVALETSGHEVVYPDNYLGAYSKIQKANKHHHVGGALFDRRALNFLKFTDGLRGHDSLDLFVRAQKTLKIGYLDQPIFFYTQRKGSLSKTNIKIRAKIKKDILAGIGL